MNKLLLYSLGILFISVACSTKQPTCSPSGVCETQIAEDTILFEKGSVVFHWIVPRGRIIEDSLFLGVVDSFEDIYPTLLGNLFDTTETTALGCGYIKLNYGQLSFQLIDQIANVLSYHVLGIEIGVNSRCAGVRLTKRQPNRVYARLQTYLDTLDYEKVKWHFQWH